MYVVFCASIEAISAVISGAPGRSIVWQTNIRMTFEMTLDDIHKRVGCSQQGSNSAIILMGDHRQFDVVS